MYGHGRNAVETLNAYAKDESKQALGTQSRRRVRGYAAQYFMCAVLVAAANMRKILAFLTKKRIDDAHAATTAGKSRAKRCDPALSYFRKRKNPVASEPDQTSDTDQDDDPLLSLLTE